MHHTAKKRTAKRDESLLNDRSINSLKRLITSEEKKIPSKCSYAQKFIPFICERDSVGRLITADFLPKIRLHKSNKSVKACPKSFSKINSKNRLLKKDSKNDIPPVGSYNLAESWIKKTFSHKLNDFAQVSTLIKTKRCSEEKPVTHKLSNSIKKQRRVDSVLPRIKGVWEDIPLQKVSDKFLYEGELKSEFRGILKCHLNITKSLDKLRLF